MIHNQIPLEVLEKNGRGVCILDSKLNIQFWNGWLVQKTGIKKDEIFGKPFTSVVKQKARFYVTNRLEEIVQSGLSAFFSQSFNKYLIEIPISSSHRYRFMQQKVVAKAIVRDQKMEFIVVYIDDVTIEAERIYDLNNHRKNLEKIVSKRTKELQEAKEDLERKVWERTRELEKAKEVAEIANESKNSFLANVSHEIRTPMNAILGFSEILSELITDPQQKKYLSTILSSGNILLTVIDDILDISKIEADELKIDYSAANLNNIFAEIASIFSQHFETKKIQLIVSSPSDLPGALLLDESRIRQILINLLGNAVKFTEKGTVKLSAAFQHSNKKENMLDLVIKVEDTGMGIPEDQQELIFEAFQQQKRQDHAKYGGSGLGLAITRKLLEKMNGSISVSSVMGEGTTFTVELNDVEVCQYGGIGQAGEQNDLISHGGTGALILIADDIESNRELLAGYLNDFDYKIIEASDGREALTLVEKHRPDLILMDIRMPVMDGNTAARMLKENPDLSHIPVLAMSAGAVIDEESIIAEFDAFLQKPIGKRQFLATIAEILNTDKSDKLQLATVKSPEIVSDSIDQDNPIDLALESLLVIMEEAKNTVLLDLLDTMTINEIEKFARTMKSHGDSSKYKPLQQWSACLLNQVLSFEIAEFSVTLKEFDLLITDLIRILQLNK
jgi:signal transduction histidine kinase/CheY-like chemotaxis protein